MKIFNVNNYIEELRDDEYYYSKDNPGLSASTLKKFHPSYRYKTDTDGWKHPLSFGSAVHHSILEPEKFFDTKFIEEPENLNKADRDAIERIYGAVMLHKQARDIITHPDALFEVPAAKMYEGILLKGKFDIVLGDMLYDIKTTSSIDSFDYTGSQIFMYPLSNYHYGMLSGRRQNFIVVDKKTFEVRIVETDDDYYRLGKRQWDEAWNEFINQQTNGTI